MKLRSLRPLLLLGALVLIWLVIEYRSPQSSLFPPDDPTEPERVTDMFVRCDSGGAYACVVDGDTFRLGRRKVRIRGIDAPEVGDKARCPEEARLGEAATERLVDLLNRDAFTMTAKRGNAIDQYGRQLRILTASDGTNLGDTLINEGLVRRYRGRKESWC